MNGIKFIRDDTQEKKTKQLKEILDLLSVKPRDQDVEAAKRFFYIMLRSAQEIAERKKEEAEKEKVIKALGLKTPPKQKEWVELKTPAMRRMLEEEHQTLIPPMPEEIQELKAPRPEEFKKPEEQPQAEDAMENISKSYPLALFKNIKGEAIAQVNILRKNRKVVYELTEPEIDFRLVEETKKLIQKDFQKDKKIIKNEKFLTKSIQKAFKNLKIDYTEEYKEEIKYFLYKDMLGLGRIDPLIHDHNVKTVICNGLNKPVKITLGLGIDVATNIVYTKKEDLDEQIKHLGLMIKNEISENNPIVEGTFYNFKIEATLGLGEVESKFIIKNMP